MLRFLFYQAIYPVRFMPLVLNLLLWAGIPNCSDFKDFAEHFVSVFSVYHPVDSLGST